MGTTKYGEVGVGVEAGEIRAAFADVDTVSGAGRLGLGAGHTGDEGKGTSGSGSGASATACASASSKSISAQACSTAWSGNGRGDGTGVSGQVGGGELGCVVVGKTYAEMSCSSNGNMHYKSSDTQTGIRPLPLMRTKRKPGSHAERGAEERKKEMQKNDYDLNLSPRDS